MTTQREALARTIAAGSLTLDDRHAAIVELARTLADQCDAAGPDGPSTRLSAAYLSAVRRAPTKGSTLQRLRAAEGHRPGAA